jgi:hypothetical protein
MPGPSAPASPVRSSNAAVFIAKALRCVNNLTYPKALVFGRAEPAHLLGDIAQFQRNDESPRKPRT